MSIRKIPSNVIPGPWADKAAAEKAVVDRTLPVEVRLTLGAIVGFCDLADRRAIPVETAISHIRRACAEHASIVTRPLASSLVEPA